MIREIANIERTYIWKSDSWKSVEFYNNWFLSFAPQAFRLARKGVMKNVMDAFENTNDLTNITVESVLEHPSMMEVLRMITAPPLAQDRLSGLSFSNKSILKALEKGKLPKDIESAKIAIGKMIDVIEKMIDKELFPWMSRGRMISSQQRSRSASIIADRLTGVLSDPIIRNSQEKRQLESIQQYLNHKGYKHIYSVSDIVSMPEMAYSFHVNVSVSMSNERNVNMPIDVVIKPSGSHKYPIFVECKSAGDFTNTNKRRKEEAIKVTQLRSTYGDEIIFCLYLCGYFDTGYLGYEAAEGIDWVWEHRIEDFALLGI